MITKDNIENFIINVAEEIIGDTPVSVQINAAIGEMAKKVDVDALIMEVSKLREEINHLTALVGDTSVSEQINVAINGK